MSLQLGWWHWREESINGRGGLIRDMKNIAPQSFNGPKAEKESLKLYVSSWTSKQNYSFLGLSPQIFLFSGDDSGTQVSWKRALQPMGHPKYYLALTNIAHGFLPMRTVMLKVFANPAGTSGAYRGPCASMLQPQTLGSWVFTCHVIKPGLLWDMHGGGALGRVPSLLTQSARERKEV